MAGATTSAIFRRGGWQNNSLEGVGVVPPANSNAKPRAHT